MAQCNSNQQVKYLYWSRPLGSQVSKWAEIVELTTLMEKLKGDVELWITSPAFAMFFPSDSFLWWKHWSQGCIGEISSKTLCPHTTIPLQQWPFCWQLSISHCKAIKQLISCYGINAYCLSGIAVQAIWDIQDNAYKPLFHAVNHWPTVMRFALWPFVMWYAVYLHNILPSQNDSRSCF